jgi:hypothetical protein
MLSPIVESRPSEEVYMLFVGAVVPQPSLAGQHHLPHAGTFRLEFR